MEVEERRRALREALAELARILGETKRAVEEVREEIVRTVEEAAGVPLTPETRRLMSLYDLTPPPQPGLRELRRMVARSLGLPEGVELEDWLLGGRGGGGEAGGPGAEPAGEGRGEAPGGGEEAGREEGG